MVDILWCDKYHPCFIDDVYGNKENILKIREWLNDFKQKIPGTKIGLFMSGPPGIGKTSLAHLILKEYNYEIIEYNASDVRSQKSVKENLTKVLTSTNISIMKGKEVKDIAIIMDEVDGMSSGDRGGVSELVSIMNPLKNKRKKKESFINPIICISNNNTDKKLSDLRKNCIEIQFIKPSYEDILSFSKKIIEKENINIDPKALDKMIEFSQQDFRRITYLLQDIKNTFEEKKINMNNILSCISIKKIDISLFEATKKLLSNFSSMEESLQFYETDRSLVSMMVHENIIINLSKKEFKRDDSNLYKLYHYLSLGDIIDKIIYNNQTWYLQDFNGIIKCCYPSYLFNHHFMKLDYLKPILFTSILSKSAIQFSNFKSIICIKNKFKISKRYLFYINEFILYILFNQNVFLEKILSIIKHYNIDIQNIEKMIKLSKIKEDNDYKKLFTNKMKTKMKKILDIAIK